MTILIDPPTGMHPHCVCDGMCEFPCWQRYGIDRDYDPSKPGSCCCSGRVSSREPAQRREAEDAPKMTIDRLLRERHRETKRQD